MQEKIDILNTLGADVRPVPAVPFDNPMNYNHQVINIHFSLELFSESNSINELIYSWGTVDDSHQTDHLSKHSRNIVGKD